ncbi:kcnl-4 [Pristionchus pacificus]|uniref:Kcnl-4 n=1 Tax=Pristionchus pacificus TaxID=54126 RepID=A0A2A6CS02_PRIPA|nr:kcnl-4 [Pristionchus pacificus]|eukprot:PDM80823.1 kcnl-4 [Pristionchus pacificus]
MIPFIHNVSPSNFPPLPSLHNLLLQMAAVRAGAIGLARGNRYLVFSTNTRKDWSEDGRNESGNESDRASIRKGKGYGVSSISAETAQSRYTQRKKMTDLKLTLCDWTLVLAMFGLLLAIIDCEISAGENFEDFSVFRHRLSLGIRTSIILSTLILIFVLICYHIADTKIHLIESGADQWRVVMDRRRIIHISTELIVCAICPFPVVDGGSVTWPMLGQTAALTSRHFKLPINVLLALPMFGRMYLLARYVVMHSALYQDCATRTIASLNQVSVDFRFVMKSALYAKPLTVLTVTSVIFWLIIAWCLTQCERYAWYDANPHIPGIQHFLDFLWFTIITFFSIGYGDIQVRTFCGRGLAMLTAIIGTLFASTLIALVSRKISLSSSEKRVNHLIDESKIVHRNKDAAARVLQATWRVVLQSRREEGTNSLRRAQRNLLKSIIKFRKSRLRLRATNDEEDDFFTARKAFLETEEHLTKVRRRQNELNEQLNCLFGHVQSLTTMIQ